MRSPRWLVAVTLGSILLFFSADKIFLIPAVKMRTQKDPTYLYYEYKYELLDELERAYRQGTERGDGTSGDAARPKLLVVIGSSRLLFYDYENFRRNHPGWDVFNFSVPVNAPAYYAFILDRIYERGIRPDALLLESDPFQFNEYSPGYRRSNLQYSFDLRFMLSHFEMFDRDDVSTFLGRWLFGGLKYPPYPDRLMMLFQSRRDRYTPLFHATDAHTRRTHGCGYSPIPVAGWFEKDFSTLTISARGTVGWLYSGYRVSDRQWTFFEYALNLVRQAGTPVLIIRPQVSRAMQHVLDGDQRIQKYGELWRTRLSTLIQPDEMLDLSGGDPYYCNAFVDSSHMAVECYDPVLDAAMRHFTEAVPVPSGQPK